VRGAELNEIGILYDFKALKNDLSAILAPLDHTYLNDVPPFDGVNPTAEHLSRYIFDELSARAQQGWRWSRWLFGSLLSLKSPTEVSKTFIKRRCSVYNASRMS